MVPHNEDTKGPDLRHSGSPSVHDSCEFLKYECKNGNQTEMRYFFSALDQIFINNLNEDTFDNYETLYKMHFMNR